MTLLYWYTHRAKIKMSVDNWPTNYMCLKCIVADTSMVISNRNIHFGAWPVIVTILMLTHC